MNYLTVGTLKISKLYHCHSGIFRTANGSSGQRDFGSRRLDAIRYLRLTAKRLHISSLGLDNPALPNILANFVFGGFKRLVAVHAFVIDPERLIRRLFPDLRLNVPLQQLLNGQVLLPCFPLQQKSSTSASSAFFFAS